MTDNLSVESRENLTAVLEMIKGKNTENKIKIIKLMLNVNMVESEVSHKENTLKEILISRMPVTCPKCKGENIDLDNFTPCSLCKGVSEVTGVQEEEYLAKK